MSNIDFVRRFYAHDRLTPGGQAAILAMFDDDVRYVGVGKVSVRGIEALRALWADGIASKPGVTKAVFDIKHIAENGNTVLAHLVATYTINGADKSFVLSVVFEIENGKIVFWQEHYPVDDIESAKRAARG